MYTKLLACILRQLVLSVSAKDTWMIIYHSQCKESKPDKRRASNPDGNSVRKFRVILSWYNGIPEVRGGVKPMKKPKGHLNNHQLRFHSYRKLLMERMIKRRGSPIRNM